MRYLLLTLSLVLTSCSTTWSQSETNTVETEKAGVIRKNTTVTTSEIGVKWNNCVVSGIASYYQIPTVTYSGK